MEEKTFRNLKAVAVYLRSHGFAVSKSTVYAHAKQKKLISRENGLFYLSDIEVYAASYLKLKNVNSQGKTDGIQQRRNIAEARKMEAQAKHWEVKAQIESGNYVDRSLFERELSYRAMVFKNDLENFARTKAQAICQKVNGQHDLIPDLIEYLLEEFAIFLNHYAEDREFMVPGNAGKKVDHLEGDPDDVYCDDKENTEK